MNPYDLPASVDVIDPICGDLMSDDLGSVETLHQLVINVILVGSVGRGGYRGGENAESYDR